MPSSAEAKTAISPSPVVLTTLPLELSTAIAQDAVVARQRLAHVLRMLLPQARAALDVREQEGQRV